VVIHILNLGHFEEFLKKNILLENTNDINKKISKRNSDLISFYNLYLPFNIIMKYQNFYQKYTTEISENLSITPIGSTEPTDKYNVY
jgi:hypothetical protein